MMRQNQIKKTEIGGPADGCDVGKKHDGLVGHIRIVSEDFPEAPESKAQKQG